MIFKFIIVAKVYKLSNTDKYVSEKVLVISVICII